MKKAYLTVIIILSVFQFTYAQWTVNGSNIYVTTPSNVIVGNATSETVDTSATLFPGVVPKMEILTSGSASPFSELVTIRHAGVGVATGPHQLGFVLKLSNESSINESAKMGGMLLESNNTYSNTPSLSLLTNNTRQLTILSTGNIGIGITSPQNKLDVNGTIHSKQVNVDMNGWSDYVFKPDYHLPSLTTVKSYVDLYHHLPEIPSEKEIATNGLNLGDIDRLLTKKVEELTLYLIEKDEREKKQEIQLDAQKEQLQLAKAQLEIQADQIQQLKDAVSKLTESVNKRLN